MTSLMICLLMAGLLLSGCQELKGWRDNQIQKSKQAVQSPQVAPPAQPIVIPQDVLESLPLDPSMTFVTYSATASNDEVRLSAISGWGVEETCKWMLSRMQHDGYECGDNPSRILEGLEFYRLDEKRQYALVSVKVTLNTADQCLVEIQARK